MKEYKTISAAIEENLDKFFEMHNGQFPESGLHKRVMKEVECVLIKKTIDYSGGGSSKGSTNPRY